MKQIFQTRHLNLSYESKCMESHKHTRTNGISGLKEIHDQPKSTQTRLNQPKSD